jgi:non-homologous end joining protein Ku
VDLHRDDLLRIIEEKVDRGDVNVITEEEEVPKPSRAKDVDLMAMLERSLEEGPKKKKPAAHKKTAKRAKKKTSRKKAA